jgi:hypothetical protein
MSTKNNKNTIPPHHGPSQWSDVAKKTSSIRPSFLLFVLSV